MALILDLLVLVIIGLSIFLAYKKGLIRTLFSLVGFVVAIVLSVNLCKPVAHWLDREFINPAVKNLVLSAVNGNDAIKDYEQALEKANVVDIFQEMPDSLRDFLENLNVDIDGMIAMAEKSEKNSTEAKEQLIDSVAAPISAAISNTIAMIGLMIILFVLLLIGTKLLDAIFRVLPFAKSVNSVGGIIFGLIRGLLFTVIFCAVVYGLSRGNVLVTSETLDNTYIVKTVNEFNPILSVF
ncbi:MAG: CvpA family protein [Clostridia bacterium]|nr:CvpA family protein [Clostridia bacterium]